MMRTKTFAEIRQDAPAILVSRDDEITVLVAPPQDTKYNARPHSRDFIEGSGSRQFPYTFVSASDRSPHFGIVELWFRFHWQPWPVFIRVNDWLLRVEQTGVRAANNWFTRLLPLPSERRV